MCRWWPRKKPRQGRIAAVGSRFFLVDPVDGTKEFVKRGGEFTVNIGEIVDGVPVAGVVLAPAIGRLFAGDENGAFEFRMAKRRVRSPPACPRRTDWWQWPVARIPIQRPMPI